MSCHSWLGPAIVLIDLWIFGWSGLWSAVQRCRHSCLNVSLLMRTTISNHFLPISLFWFPFKDCLQAYFIDFYLCFWLMGPLQLGRILSRIRCSWSPPVGKRMALPRSQILKLKSLQSHDIWCKNWFIWICLNIDYRYINLEHSPPHFFCYRYAANLKQTLQPRLCKLRPPWPNIKLSSGVAITGAWGHGTSGTAAQLLAWYLDAGRHGNGDNSGHEGSAHTKHQSAAHLKVWGGQNQLDRMDSRRFS